MLSAIGICPAGAPKVTRPFTLYSFEDATSDAMRPPCEYPFNTTGDVEVIPACFMASTTARYAPGDSSATPLMLLVMSKGSAAGVDVNLVAGCVAGLRELLDANLLAIRLLIGRDELARTLRKRSRKPLARVNAGGRRGDAGAFDRHSGLPQEAENAAELVDHSRRRGDPQHAEPIRPEQFRDGLRYPEEALPELVAVGDHFPERADDERIRDDARVSLEKCAGGGSDLRQ
jgi:hypothetical protein